MNDTVSVTFTLSEWDRILHRADALMKQSNGHSFMTILKTRCQYCGRSPRARGKCPAWPTTFTAQILFVLMNKEQELAPRAGAAEPTGMAHDWRMDTVLGGYRCNRCLVAGDKPHGPTCPKGAAEEPTP